MARHLDVGVRAEDLVDEAAPPVQRQVHGHADHLHEEELREQRDDVGLDAGRAAQRIAQVADLEAALGAGGGGLDVVAEHELVRLAHRVLRLVLVRAAGEREQLADPLEHAVEIAAAGGVGCGRRRRARRSRARRRRAGTSRRGPPRRARRAPRRRTGAPSRAGGRRAPRATAASTTSARDSSSVRVPRSHWPSRVAASESANTGAASRLRNRAWFSQSNDARSSRSSAASSSADRLSRSIARTLYAASDAERGGRVGGVSAERGRRSPASIAPSM